MANDKGEKTTERILSILASHRGSSLVSSADCSQQEISVARSNGRLFVDSNGFGFVLRLAPPSPSGPATSFVGQIVQAIDSHPSFGVKMKFHPVVLTWPPAKQAA